LLSLKDHLFLIGVHGAQITGTSLREISEKEELFIKRHEGYATSDSSAVAQDRGPSEIATRKSPIEVR